MNRTVRLFRFVDDFWVDPWGKFVDVLRLVDTVDVNVTGTRKYDNGYEITDVPEGTTEDGRVFWKPIEIDYFGNYYWREENSADIQRLGQWRDHFSKKGRYVDADGNPITGEEIK